MTGEKTYHGRRDADGSADVWVTLPRGAEHPGQECAPSYPLDPRFDLRNHSPTGFEWGYGGSGPAQLALALLADALEDDGQAQALYQAFKWRVLGRLNRDRWTLTQAEIRQHVTALRAGETHD